MSGAVGLASGLTLALDATPTVEILLSTTKTVSGQPISYPAGTAEITGAIVTLEPGQRTGWHRHDVPLFAYVLEGELTIDYGDAGVHVFSAGDAFVEAMGTDHNGMISGQTSARVLAVFAGAEGTPNTVPSQR
ncbi:MAG: cupin domain-containing protein [Pseudomonadota bacterium]